MSYFRFLEHVGPSEDFNAGYRKRPTPEEWERWDPVRRWEETLVEIGCPSLELEAVRREVDEKLERSLKVAQEAPFPPASELTTDLFSEGVVQEEVVG